MDISRREAIKKAALMLGGIIVIPDILKAWDGTPIANTNFRLTLLQEDTLDELCETIMPTTSTPGAKAAGVPAFVRKIVADCRPQKDQTLFVEGLDMLNNTCRKKYNTSFSTASLEQRTNILKEVEATGSDFWKMIKHETVTGYFTSEIGLTQNTRYDIAPGSYDGSAPYKKGDKIQTGGYN